MNKLIFLLLILVSAPIFADISERFRSEQEAFEHRVKYRLLHSGGDWRDGEFFPNLTTPYGSSWHIQGDFYYKMNAYRKENGLRRVSPIRILEKSATVSARMCAYNDEKLDHDLFDGWDICRYCAVFIEEVPRYIAENLVKLPIQNDHEAQLIFDMWKNSPGHNKAMLNPKIRYMGLGGIEHGGGRFWALHMVDDFYPLDTLTDEQKEVMGYVSAEQ